MVGWSDVFEQNLRKKMGLLCTMQKINLIAQSVLELSHCEKSDDDEDEDDDDDNDTHQG